MENHNIKIYAQNEFKKEGLNCPYHTKYTRDKVENYSYAVIIPYEKYSTKIDGIKKYWDMYDFSVFEFRVHTMYLSAVIMTKDLDTMNKILTNEEIIKPRDMREI